MFRLKQLLKKDKVRILLAAAALATAGLAVRRVSGLLRNLSDWLFMAGLVLIFVGCVRYISNVGLFKTFSYSAYKRRWRRNVPSAGEARPMSLAEYTQNVILDDARQKPVGWAFAAGLACCGVSLLLAVLA